MIWPAIFQVLGCMGNMSSVRFMVDGSAIYWTRSCSSLILDYILFLVQDLVMDEVLDHNQNVFYEELQGDHQEQYLPQDIAGASIVIQMLLILPMHSST